MMEPYQPYFEPESVAAAAVAGPVPDPGTAHRASLFDVGRNSLSLLPPTRTVSPDLFLKRRSSGMSGFLPPPLLGT